MKKESLQSEDHQQTVISVTRLSDSIFTKSQKLQELCQLKNNLKFWLICALHKFMQNQSR